MTQLIFLNFLHYFMLFSKYNSCGQFTLFSFSWPGSRPGSDVWNGLYYTIRQPPFTNAELTDMDYNVDFSTVTTENDRVAVITTKPLTKNETWIEMKKGELLMFDKGLPYAEANKCEIAEKEGRGLSCKRNLPRFHTVDPILIPDKLHSLENTYAGSTNCGRVGDFLSQVTQNH